MQTAFKLLPTVELQCRTLPTPTTRPPSPDAAPGSSSNQQMDRSDRGRSCQRPTLPGLLPPDLRRGLRQEPQWNLHRRLHLPVCLLPVRVGNCPRPSELVHSLPHPIRSLPDSSPDPAGLGGRPAGKHLGSLPRALLGPGRRLPSLHGQPRGRHSRLSPLPGPVLPTGLDPPPRQGLRAAPAGGVHRAVPVHRLRVRDHHSACSQDPRHPAVPEGPAQRRGCLSQHLRQGARKDRALPARHPLPRRSDAGLRSPNRLRWGQPAREGHSRPAHHGVPSR